MVESYPVNLHLDRQIFGIIRPYPRAAKLHIQQEVVGTVERELPLLVRLDPGIGEGVHIVYLE